MADQQAPPTPTGHGGTRDLPGWAQVFAALFPIVAGVATAVTTAGALAVILAALAALALSVAMIAGLTHRLPDRRKKIIAVTAVCAAVVLVAATAVAASASRRGAPAAPPQTGAGDGTDGEPVMSSSGYKLRPSSETRTNDQDKVDLDTGCPGWGSMDILIGPQRCGEKAELILEEDTLHTPDNATPIVQPSGGTRANQAACRELLSKSGGPGEIPLSDLADGAELCVRTDKGRIAAVHVVSLTGSPVLTIDFEVWDR